MQVRRIVCERLASILGVVKRPSPSYSEKPTKTEPAQILDEGFAALVEHQPPKTDQQVLVDIRNLLRQRASFDEEERNRVRAEARIRQEWMLAARVVNRACFVFFASTLVGVTVVFFFVFRLHH